MVNLEFNRLGEINKLHSEVVIAVKTALFFVFFCANYIWDVFCIYIGVDHIVVISCSRTSVFLKAFKVASVIYCPLSLGYQMYLMTMGHAAFEIKYFSNPFSAVCSLLDVPTVLALPTAVRSTRAVQVSTTQRGP